MPGVICTYDPGARYEVRVHDLAYRSDQAGTWSARIYQPQGRGPFPALVDIHGGAWNRGSITDNQRIDQELAASGLVVAAIGLRQAPQYPYPAQVADVNYATRWLKVRASDFNADPPSIGGLGTSSGGHSIMLSAMRPRDPRYTVLSDAATTDADATLLYVLAAWPVLDPYARYCFAKEQGRDALIQASEAYFLTSEAMQEANPQLMLERGEQVELPPMLIVQGTADANVPLSVSQRFTEAYRASGGTVELELFAEMPHGFAREPGAESDRAVACMKAFVARQLAASRATV